MSLILASGAGIAALDDDPPPPQMPWTLAGCVEGTLSPEVVYEEEVNFLVVSGTATECEPPASTTAPTGFTLAYWGDGWGGGIDDWMIRMFPEPAGTWEPVTVPFGVATLPNVPSRMYVCLTEAAPRPAGTPNYVPWVAVPVTCMTVVITHPDGSTVPEVTTTPLPADSPLVSRTARRPTTYSGSVIPIDGTGEHDGGGNCGTCY